VDENNDIAPTAPGADAFCDDAEFGAQGKLPSRRWDENNRQSWENLRDLW